MASNSTMGSRRSSCSNPTVYVTLFLLGLVRPAAAFSPALLPLLWNTGGAMDDSGGIHHSCHNRVARTRSAIATTRLYALKSKKQAALAQKMALAKKQQQQQQEEPPTTEIEALKPSTSSSSSSIADGTTGDTAPQQPKEDKAHAEFAKLLANSKPPPRDNTKSEASTFAPTAPGSNIAKFNFTPKIKKAAASNTKTSKQEKQEAAANAEELALSRPLNLGDKARRRHFESLVDVTNDQPLGQIRAAQLVPWVPPFVTDYLVVVADPRPMSRELRRSMEYLQSLDATSSSSIYIMAVVADESSKETVAWMSRANIAPHDINMDSSNDDDASSFVGVFQEADSEWLTTYGCRRVGEEGWSMHVLIIDNDGILQVVKGGVEPAQVCSVVTEAIQELQQNGDDKTRGGKKKQNKK